MFKKLLNEMSLDTYNDTESILQNIFEDFLNENRMVRQEYRYGVVITNHAKERLTYEANGDPGREYHIKKEEIVRLFMEILKRLKNVDIHIDKFSYKNPNIRELDGLKLSKMNPQNKYFDTVQGLVIGNNSNIVLSYSYGVSKVKNYDYAISIKTFIRRHDLAAVRKESGLNTEANQTYINDLDLRDSQTSKKDVIEDILGVSNWEDYYKIVSNITDYGHGGKSYDNKRDSYLNKREGSQEEKEATPEILDMIIDSKKTTGDERKKSIVKIFKGSKRVSDLIKKRVEKLEKLGVITSKEQTNSLIYVLINDAIDEFKEDDNVGYFVNIIKRQLRKYREENISPTMNLIIKAKEESDLSKKKEYISDMIINMPSLKSFINKQINSLSMLGKVKNRDEVIFDITRKALQNFEEGETEADLENHVKKTIIEYDKGF